MVHFVRILRMAAFVCHLVPDALSALLLLKECQRIRLARRLTRPPALIIRGKNIERTAIAATCAVLFRLLAIVNSRCRNIFNGLLLVQLMK